MTLYYQRNGIEIHHGDCREVLPGLLRHESELLLTDPPYGISLNPDGRKWLGAIAHPAIFGDDKPFQPIHLLSWLRQDTAAIIWGGNCFASRLPDSTRWLTWVKSGRDDAQIRIADIELAWTCNGPARSRVFHHLWIGAFKDSESGERARHPTQKPVELMRWCINLVLDAPGWVIDPYMGSGSTLVAAKSLGHQAIGIEIEERYCEVAADRLRQDVLTW